MSLLFTMFPFYLLGNAHCFGMCGPLLSLLSHHPRRYEYFFGRFLSFSIIGGLCGTMGQLLHPHRFAAWLSILLGSSIVLWGLHTLIEFPIPLPQRVNKCIAALQTRLSSLLAQGYRGAPFLLGLFTVLLPCGQSFLIFSTSALTGNYLLGTANSALFALGTSPSLLLALFTPHLFIKRQKIHTLVLGSLSVAIGAIGICRGMAEMEIVPHCHLALSKKMEITIY